MSQSKPLILVVNDDGITAPGIKALIHTMIEIGEVVVVAPDSNQSGMSHAITSLHPIRLTPIHLYDHVAMYQCSGTPVDCVKLAMNSVLTDKKPDICVAGINHGLNNSISVLYSGTIAATVESTINNIPSISFSLDNSSHQASFDHCQKYIKEIAQQVLSQGLPSGTLLNVNFPNTAAIQGIKICRQAPAMWMEQLDKRVDPNARDYYWFTGCLQPTHLTEDTDIWAIQNNYVSVVPVQFDRTAYHTMATLNAWPLFS